MPRSSRGALLAVLSVMTVAGLVGPGSASASFLATGQDAAGDAASPDPGRDIVGVGLTYDRRTGKLMGGVKLRGEPTAEAPADLTLFAGHGTGNDCRGYPAVGFATQTDRTSVDWLRLDSGGGDATDTGRATKVWDGAAEEYTAEHRSLAGLRPNCVIAQLSETGNPAVVYDVAGPFALRGLPELELRLGKLPASIRVGSTRTVRVQVRNPGDAASGGLRLTVAKRRGLVVQMPRTVRSLRAGVRTTVAVKVRVTRRASTSTPLKITAKAASGLRASDEGRLRVGTRPRGGSGSGGQRGSRLCYRYHWLPPYSRLVVC